MSSVCFEEGLLMKPWNEWNISYHIWQHVGDCLYFRSSHRSLTVTCEHLAYFALQCAAVPCCYKDSAELRAQASCPLFQWKPVNNSKLDKKQVCLSHSFANTLLRCKGNEEIIFRYCHCKGRGWCSVTSTKLEEAACFYRDIFLRILLKNLNRSHNTCF